MFGTLSNYTIVVRLRHLILLVHRLEKATALEWTDFSPINPPVSEETLIYSWTMLSSVKQSNCCWTTPSVGLGDPPRRYVREPTKTKDLAPMLIAKYFLNSQL